MLPWTLFIALLMISQRPDLHLVVDPHPPRLAAVRAAGVALLGAALLNEPWWTLLAISVALPGAAAVQHRQLRPGQAAARSAGCASAGRAAV